MTDIQYELLEKNLNKPVQLHLRGSGLGRESSSSESFLGLVRKLTHGQVLIEELNGETRAFFLEDVRDVATGGLLATQFRIFRAHRRRNRALYLTAYRLNLDQHTDQVRAAVMQMLKDQGYPAPPDPENTIEAEVEAEQLLAEEEISRETLKGSERPKRRLN